MPGREIGVFGRLMPPGLVSLGSRRSTARVALTHSVFSDYVCSYTMLLGQKPECKLR